jgi:AAA15 family ATPase/GTPase
MLFETFIKILSSGGIAVIDEMESDLHPHLIPTILSLFTNAEINTHQAQLFFTCHHVEMLNHLLKEQIIFVEKNEQCVSEAFRLDELKGVRREENFFANYNSGRYGAIPEPEVVAF